MGSIEVAVGNILYAWLRSAFERLDPGIRARIRECERERGNQPLFGARAACLRGATAN
jgi:hypothetical protein